MRRSKSEIDLHFVWATYRRMPLVTPACEQAIYACILGEARRHDCDVLALGGMPDHVHLALTMPPKSSPATLMRCIKGVSSTFVRQTLAPGAFFGWQDGYAVFAVCRSHRETVVSYIRGQKQHHKSGVTLPEWEEVDEETPDRKPGGEFGAPGV